MSEERKVITWFGYAHDPVSGVEDHGTFVSEGEAVEWARAALDEIENSIACYEPEVGEEPCVYLGRIAHQAVLSTPDVGWTIEGIQ